MIYRLIRPLLFALDPETSHRVAINALKAGLYPRAPAPDPRLRRRVLALDFPNPIGLAAGFDKNAEVVDAALAMGFGFVEVGTVTPLPQAGNPRPRMFRLTADRAIVNRLGFNNEGHEAVHARLAARERRGVVGVNLGANKDSADRVADYVAGVRRFADVADYLTINISSPNTPGLRDLQEKEALTRLLGAIAEARGRLARSPPVLVKIAPDLDEPALFAIVETVAAAGIDGMIVSNTTVARDGLTDLTHANEVGGLSGRPLFRRSTDMLAAVRRLAGEKLVLVGVGGVDSVAAAQAKIDAGADLVQLYTGMVYEGPRLPARIVADLTPRTPVRS
ncbi:MAG: quinone-dependent dihydroorotate dehydrogenase [Dongiaceae bacterium]